MRITNCCRRTGNCRGSGISSGVRVADGVAVFIRGGLREDTAELDFARVSGLLVKESETWYRHMVEGPDDMTSHIRAALTQMQISVPLHEGRLALGTWQGIYVFEHRATPHRRSVLLHMLGE